MRDLKLPVKVAKQAPQPRPRGHDVSGQAAAAERNRKQQARLRIIEAFTRLGTPYDHWPDFVREFKTNPLQQTEYRQSAIPPPFQPPEFDRLNQSPQEWAKVADRAWELHRTKFLSDCEYWIKVGVDEEIVPPKRARGPGTKNRSSVRRQTRGDNTSIDLRYEWAAKYLLNTPLKEIAGADADASTIGRVAREILRSAGWPTKSRAN